LSRTCQRFFAEKSAFVEPAGSERASAGEFATESAAESAADLQRNYRGSAGIFCEKNSGLSNVMSCGTIGGRFFHGEKTTGLPTDTAANGPTKRTERTSLHNIDQLRIHNASTYAQKQCARQLFAPGAHLPIL
jgi:hypothetical protein